MPAEGILVSGLSWPVQYRQMLDPGVVDDLQGYFPAGGPAERQGPCRAYPLPLLRADFPPEGVLNQLQVLFLGVGQVEQDSLEAFQLMVCRLGICQFWGWFPVIVLACGFTAL